MRCLMLLLVLLAGCTGTATLPAPQVSVAWTGEADIDLELWSDTGYLCDAADFTGAEQFAFRTYTETENLRGQVPADFRHGTYTVVAACWEATGPVTVTAILREHGETTVSNALQKNELWRIARRANGRFTVVNDTCFLPRDR